MRNVKKIKKESAVKEMTTEEVAEQIAVDIGQTWETVKRVLGASATPKLAQEVYGYLELGERFEVDPEELKQVEEDLGWALDAVKETFGEEAAKDADLVLEQYHLMFVDDEDDDE